MCMRCVYVVNNGSILKFNFIIKYFELESFFLKKKEENKLIDKNIAFDLTNIHNTQDRQKTTSHTTLAPSVIRIISTWLFPLRTHAKHKAQTQSTVMCITSTLPTPSYSIPHKKKKENKQLLTIHSSNQLYLEDLNMEISHIRKTLIQTQSTVM